MGLIAGPWPQLAAAAILTVLAVGVSVAIAAEEVGSFEVEGFLDAEEEMSEGDFMSKVGGGAVASQASRTLLVNNPIQAEAAILAAVDAMPQALSPGERSRGQQSSLSSLPKAVKQDGIEAALGGYIQSQVETRDNIIAEKARAKAKNAAMHMPMRELADDAAPAYNGNAFKSYYGFKEPDTRATDLECYTLEASGGQCPWNAAIKNSCAQCLRGGCVCGTPTNQTYKNSCARCDPDGYAVMEDCGLPCAPNPDNVPHYSRPKKTFSETWADSSQRRRSKPGQVLDALMINLTLAPLYFEQTKFPAFKKELKAALGMASGIPVHQDSFDILGIIPNTKLNKVQFHNMAEKTAEVNTIWKNACSQKRLGESGGFVKMPFERSSDAEAVYAANSFDTNICPKGYNHVNVAGCSKAMIAFGRNQGASSNWSGSWSNKPKGCSFDGRSGQFHFNSHPGEASRDIRPVCSCFKPCAVETNHPTVSPTASPTRSPIPFNPNCSASPPALSKPTIRINALFLPSASNDDMTRLAAHIEKSINSSYFSKVLQAGLKRAGLNVETFTTGGDTMDKLVVLDYDKRSLMPRVHNVSMDSCVGPTTGPLILDQQYVGGNAQNPEDWKKFLRGPFKNCPSPDIPCVAYAGPYKAETVLDGSGATLQKMDFDPNHQKYSIELTVRYPISVVHPSGTLLRIGGRPGRWRGMGPNETFCGGLAIEVSGELGSTLTFGIQCEASQQTKIKLPDLVGGDEFTLKFTHVEGEVSIFKDGKLLSKVTRFVNIPWTSDVIIGPDFIFGTNCGPRCGLIKDVMIQDHLHAKKYHREPEPPVRWYECQDKPCVQEWFYDPEEQVNRCGNRCKPKITTHTSPECSGRNCRALVRCPFGSKPISCKAVGSVGKQHGITDSPLVNPNGVTKETCVSVAFAKYRTVALASQNQSIANGTANITTLNSSAIPPGCIVRTGSSSETPGHGLAFWNFAASPLKGYHGIGSPFEGDTSDGDEADGDENQSASRKLLNLGLGTLNEVETIAGGLGDTSNVHELSEDDNGDNDDDDGADDDATARYIAVDPMGGNGAYMTKVCTQHNNFEFSHTRIETHS